MVTLGLSVDRRGNEPCNGASIFVEAEADAVRVVAGNKNRSQEEGENGENLPGSESRASYTLLHYVHLGEPDVLKESMRDKAYKAKERK